ncbi:MAG: galactose-1-phosphate uridylyltransferase [Methanospirillum sp.]
MFVIEERRNGTSPLQYRRERLTGLSCTISPGRLLRGLDHPIAPPTPPAQDCPFCPGRLDAETPTFSDGTRIRRGESVTFPNRYPFAERHTVGVICRSHEVERITVRQLADALEGVAVSLEGARGYPSINWNYLASAGASMPHPHLQGLADRRPSRIQRLYIDASARYRARRGSRYWDDLSSHEAGTDRWLFGGEVPFIASAVPLGEREVRGLLPVATLEEAGPYLEPLASGICRVLDLYRSFGTQAFNVAVFFDRAGSHRGFSAFCSMIARINPNPASISDSAFMERLHQHPVVMTLPEELGLRYRAIDSEK